MKRYIRSTSDWDRLAYEKDGVTEHLPTWFADKSDEELEELKRRVINSPRPKPTSSRIEFDEKALYDDLRKAGFSRSDAEEIIAMVAGGMTLDAAMQRQIDKSIHASEDVVDEYDDLVDAILNNKPYDYDRFHEYWQAFHQPEKGAIRADQVKIGDVLKNTEDATEFDIGDVFKVNSITEHFTDWEEFDYTFNITLLKGAEKYVDAIDTFDIHYMADEYVGVPVSVNASTSVTGSKKVKVSPELRSILEDVMIDTLDSYSGSHVLSEFVENVRYLQSWDEYDEAHPDEMIELSRLSNNKLVDIGAEILDEVKAGWQGDEG